LSNYIYKKSSVRLISKNCILCGRNLNSINILETELNEEINEYQCKYCELYYTEFESDLISENIEEIII
jgi:transcription elongation factor Elf1